MEIEIYKLLLIALVALVASYIQSITGFGFGIVAMIFLPHILIYTEANVLSTITSVLTSLIAWVITRKHTNFKNLLFPLIGCTVSTFFTVSFVKSQDNDFLTLLLGIALIVLSVYFFFFSDRIKIKPTFYAGLIAGLLSGILGGMFSIGGPPVVIYYLQSEENSNRYFATISAYFVLSGIVSIGMKAASGFVTLNVWLGLAVGVVAMALGSFIGRLTRSKSKPLTIRRAIYAVMALSGIVNVVTTLLA